MLRETGKIFSVDQFRSRRWQWLRQKARSCLARTVQGTRPFKRHLVKAPDPPRQKASVLEVALIERLQRMADENAVPGDTGVDPDSCIDDVEQLADRHAGWTSGIGPFVIARVSD